MCTMFSSSLYPTLQTEVTDREGSSAQGTHCESLTAFGTDHGCYLKQLKLHEATAQRPDRGADITGNVAPLLDNTTWPLQRAGLETAGSPSWGRRLCEPRARRSAYHHHFFVAPHLLPAVAFALLLSWLAVPCRFIVFCAV